MDSLIHGFTIVSKTALDEMQAEGVFARHAVTGLEVYHIHNDDTENLFAFAFMTPPKNSSGVAHILEHSVLCGSKHYPLDDPFLVLSRQSVKTFLNAMTFPDKTVYPASSILEKDYFNVMSVYGDAVFFPLLKKGTFEQEGYRLEMGKDGAPSFSGVVLNEMRGAYTDFDSAVDREVRRSLFPGTVYEYDSGGYPPDIVHLRYEDFCAFHKAYYHPVNCKVFLYGNIDTEKQLAFLQDRFLRFFEPAQKPPLIPPIHFSSASGLYSKAAPATDGKKKDTVTVNWLLSESADIDHYMDCMFLEELLLGHDGAPLQKKLLDCPFAEDLYPYNGGQAELKNICFTLGLADIDKNSVGQVEPFIRSSLESIVRNELEPHLIETALNGLDFYHREIIRAGGPFSLTLMRRVLRGWIYGFHPEKSLRTIPALQRLKQRIAENPQYCQDLIRRLLLENKCYTVVSVYPDSDFCRKLDDVLAEQACSQAVVAHTGHKTACGKSCQKQASSAAGRFQTAEGQGANRELSNLIPHISKKELPSVEPPIPETLEYFGTVPVIVHEQPTNGITYLDIVLPADSLSADEYQYVTLYAAALSAMGTKTQGWDAVAADFAYLTGGFSALPFSAGRHQAAQNTSFFDGTLPIDDIVGRDWILIRAKMLPEYIEAAVNRIFSYLHAVSFSDTKRLKDILIQLKNDLEPLPSSSGHTLAALYAASGYAGAKRAENLWMGIPQLRFLREWYKKVEENTSAIADLAQRLTGIHRIVMSSGLIVKICGTRLTLPCIKKALAPHLAQFAFPHHRTGGLTAESFKNPAALSVFPSAVQVGFAAQLVPVSFSEKEYGTSIVYAQWLETGALWQSVRVKGGAYGVSAYPDSVLSLFTLTTYRDPTPFMSLCRVLECVEQSRTVSLTNRELEALITGTYSTALQPRTPAQKSAAALYRLLNGISYQIHMETIEGIICCTQKRMSHFAENLAARMVRGTAAIICSEESMHSAQHAVYTGQGTTPLPVLTPMPPL